ncbi:MAG: hypothetical protein JRG73_10405 [Deltaproteobacteria bacterium]|nr:hypothetical protein [Deltaproteobacteria bacterium]MBW2307335.1 hypothetical protein [Deltaproteobacteria bacterium]
MADTSIYLGFVLVLIGILDILVIPLLLRRVWAEPLPQTALVLRVLRIFGLLMVIIGLMFLGGVVALPQA